MYSTLYLIIVAFACFAKGIHRLTFVLEDSKMVLPLPEASTAAVESEESEECSLRSRFGSVFVPICQIPKTCS